MGTHYEVLPIPAFSENTHIFQAGVLTFGVEYRLLNEAVIAAEYGEDARAKFGNTLPPGLPAQIDEDGVSVHVFGPDGLEYLRFDCFDDYPHYHYIEAREGRQTVMEFDPLADGPMQSWLVGCLRGRLGEMLSRAGAGDVAADWDPHAHVEVLAAVASEIEAATQRGKPTPAPADARLPAH